MIDIIVFRFFCLAKKKSLGLRHTTDYKLVSSDADRCVLHVSPRGQYEGFDIGRFSKGVTIRILWGPGVFLK